MAINPFNKLNLTINHNLLLKMGTFGQEVKTQNIRHLVLIYAIIFFVKITKCHIIPFLSFYLKKNADQIQL